MAERDAKGRFVKGEYKGGPGRPPKATEAQYLEAIGRGVSVELFEQASAKMGKLAASGDVQAYNAIKAHLAGLPTQKLQISSLDASLLAEVLELMRTRNITPGDVFQAMIQQLSAESIPDEITEGGDDDDQ